jgi:hypothetical protein
MTMRKLVSCRDRAKDTWTKCSDSIACRDHAA